MKRNILMTAVALLMTASLFASCISITDESTGNSSRNKVIKPSKNIIEKVVEGLASFTQLTLEGQGQVLIRQTDGPQRVTIEAPENYVEAIVFSVQGETLHIGRAKNITLSKGGLVHITIETPLLTSISNEGVGKIFGGTFAVDNLKLDNEGVGSIKFSKLKVGNLVVDNEGVGNIQLAGEAQNAEYDNEGVGSIDAGELKSVRAKATNEGVGSISLHATESLTALNEGVGSIRYAGNPKHKDLKREGIGSIKSK